MFYYFALIYLFNFFNNYIDSYSSYLYFIFEKTDAERGAEWSLEARGWGVQNPAF